MLLYVSISERVSERASIKQETTTINHLVKTHCLKAVNITKISQAFSKDTEANFLMENFVVIKPLT